MLSICIVHSARSVYLLRGRRYELFPRCVRSLNEATASITEPVELVVADWPGIFNPAPLKTWLWELCRIPVRIVEMSGEFNKGLGCNRAAAASQGDVLFFCDCDMLVPAEVITRGLLYARASKAWFPGYVAQQGADSDVYKPPKTPGTGNAFMPAWLFREIGPWPEKTTWGKFDRPYSTRIEQLGHSAEPIATRKPVDGFVHIWHPKYMGWKREPSR